MAIELKNRPRANLHPEFWDAVRFYTDEMGMSVVNKMRGAKNERHARKLAKKYSRVLLNMKEARDRDSKLETTLLHSDWDEIHSNAFNELVFTKHNAIMRPIRRAEANKVWNIGTYSCVVKREAFSITSPNPRQILFRPVIDVEKYPDLALYTGPNHPHQSAHTCWGGYSTWVTSSLKKFNLSDLQEAMYKFLTHYTPGDALAQANKGTFPWFEEVKRESDN